ncbi:leucine-rich repeat flightless-interacting protein 2 isoform X11 [Notamacropus eugenii]|uniref:leucine-rich repeat flightless-interacting protein 2 isoform X11 n=1 Tax=Notamacropus eugenii TaxID=9315 RepID=UPI003B6733B6
MGTPGSGRKRTPVKDRFSAEDEALSNIAREAEARLAAKRAARAEARDIRMRELERQQKEHSHRSYDRKWGQIQKWMEDAERARYSHRSSRHRPHLVCNYIVYILPQPSDFLLQSIHRQTTISFSFYYQGVEDVLSTRNIGGHRYDTLKTHSTKYSSSSHAYGDFSGTKRRSSSSYKNPLKGLYYDQRNYSSLRHSKSPSTSYTRSSSLCSDPLATSRSHRVSCAVDTGLMRSASLASLGDLGLYSPCSSRTPSEYSYSSRGSSSRSSPVFSDDDARSLASSGRASQGRRASVLDEKCDKQYAENYTRPSSRNSASATTPLSGSASRRGSGDTGSFVDPEASLSELRDIYDLKDQIQDVEGRYMQGLKELKDSLAAVEEKYKKAMVSNAQLDNEKNNLIYQVDTLKDVLEGQEEQMAEFYRENEEKSKELERQKHLCTVLQHKMEMLKEGLRQRDELIEALERQKESLDCIRNERDALREELAELKETLETGEKHGLVIIPDGTPNGDVSHESMGGAITVVSQEAAQVLESAGEGPLDVRLRKLAGEKEELLSQIRKLKLQLEEERQKSSRHDGPFGDPGGLENGSDLQLIEMQRDANRQISEYKFKLSKAEQDITTMEQNIGRLEGQVARYKNAAENAEKVEDELKADKRRLQRELRTALDKIEEMEMTNSHLMKRLEKMKANRTALLSQQ